MAMKSERLKKLESELTDLEQWLRLSLVPKKDLEKHKEEIRAIQIKIEEEKERLRFMKESGDMEEFVAPKRTPARQVYPEAHTMTDVEMGDNMTETGFNMETDGYETESCEETESGDENTVYEEEDDYFSDRNRWKRGILGDPDGGDQW